MKGRGKREQALADQIEKEPGDNQAENGLRRAQQRREATAFQQRYVRQLAQAGGAQHAVFVLGNTFTAIVLAALGTARNRLAVNMIETTLQR
jgi:hypothetical protein